MNRLLLTALLLSTAATFLRAQSLPGSSVPSPAPGTAPSGQIPSPPVPPPLRIDLQSGVTNSTTNPAFHIIAASDAVEIPVSSVSPDDEISCHALTVVFDDNGDGGPVIEWIARSGERTLLSSGLGTVGTGCGIELRTVLLPQNLTLAGGTVSVSFAGRFSRLRVIELRPCAELTVAAPLDLDRPAMLTATGRSISQQEASGGDATLLRGDTTKGNIVRAELAASPLPIDESTPMEVVVPMASGAAESFIKAEVSGLDPASRIDVSVNGIPLGPLGLESFPLDDPGTLRSPAGRLLRAGWRSGSLFVPRGLWKQGDNSVVFSLINSEGDTGTPVRLRNAVTEILFTPPNTTALTGNTSTNATAAPEPLSNGSAYGNPSPSLFHATLPTIPAPTDHTSPVGP
jgi:hypothetical protein